MRPSLGKQERKREGGVRKSERECAIKIIIPLSPCPSLQRTDWTEARREERGENEPTTLSASVSSPRPSSPLCPTTGLPSPFPIIFLSSLLPILLFLSFPSLLSSLPYNRTLSISVRDRAPILSPPHADSGRGKSTTLVRATQNIIITTNDNSNNVASDKYNVLTM